MTRERWKQQRREGSRDGQRGGNEVRARSKHALGLHRFSTRLLNKEPWQWEQRDWRASPRGFNKNVLKHTEARGRKLSHRAISRAKQFRCLLRAASQIRRTANVQYVTLFSPRWLLYCWQKQAFTRPQSNLILPVTHTQAHAANEKHLCSHSQQTVEYLYVLWLMQSIMRSCGSTGVSPQEWIMVVR